MPKDTKGRAKPTKASQGSVDEAPGPQSEVPDIDGEFEAALQRLDLALDQSLRVKGRGGALAALTVATSELNGLLSNETMAAPVQITPDYAYLGEHRVLSITADSSWKSHIPFYKPKSEEDQQKVGDKVQKYWGTVEKLVAKYQPTQYQITIGFPLGVSLTLSWDVSKGTSPAGSDGTD